MLCFSRISLIAAMLIAGSSSLFWTTSITAAQDPPRGDALSPKLKVGDEIKAQMHGGEAQSYSVTLRSGQFMHIVVDQLGIGAIVMLIGPNGKSLVAVDFPIEDSGAEQISFLVKTSGVYRVEVRAVSGGASSGDYSLKLEELRDSRADDRMRIAAQDLITKGSGLWRQKSPEARRASIEEFKKAIGKYRSGHDSEGEATASYILGYIHRDLGDRQKATEYLGSAIQTFQDLDDRLAEATAVYALGVLYREQGKYADAEKLLLRADRIYERELRQDAPFLLTVVSNLALLYTDEGKYADAEPLFQRVLRGTEGNLGPEHPDVAQALNHLAVLYYRQGKSDLAEQFHLRALKIREKALGNDHPATAESLNNLAAVYWQQGKYTSVEPLLKRVIGIYEKGGGPESRDLAGAYGSLGALYSAEGKYGEAESLCQRALVILERVMGPEHPDVATALNNLAELYSTEGKYALAEPRYQRSLAIMEKTVGIGHPDFATIQSNLGMVYVQEANFGAAEPLFRQSLETLTKVLGQNNPQVALASMNLASVYRAEGKYVVADPLIQRAVEIYEATLGENHPTLGVALFNLASLYYFEAKYAEAEPIVQRTISIFEKSLGPEHVNVAKAYDVLGAIFNGQGKFARAEEPARRSLAILEKVFGLENLDVANSLNNLAVIEHIVHKDTDAEQLLQRAIKIREKMLPPGHPALAQSLNNLAKIYEDEGKYHEAGPIYKQALAFREEALGPDHPDVGNSLLNLAMFDYARELPSEAGANFERAAANIKAQFAQHFTYMSERERLAFLDSVSYFYPSYLSFCLTYRDKQPGLADKIYDLVLWQKGLIAASISSVSRRVAGSGDKQGLELLDQFIATRTQLAELFSTAPRDVTSWRNKMDRLQQDANSIERQLVKRSFVLPGEEKAVIVSWRGIQKSLAKGDAAVEIVRFPFHNGKQWTQTAYYLAIVVTAESETAPMLVLLGEASKLEGEPLRKYRAAVAARDPAELDTGLKSLGGGTVPAYEAFWKPIEAALSGVKRIYLSPDGVLNEVPIGIFSAEDGQLLMQKYDLHLVSSTKDLLQIRPPTANHSAVLVGNPQFALSEPQQRAALQKLQVTEEPKPLLTALSGGKGRSRDQDGNILAPLPATEEEIESIGRLLKNAGWKTELYTKERALEEAVKRVQNPQVLHIATHAFFFPDQERNRPNLAGELPSGLEDPMLRSGLYLAGADRVLSRQAPPEGLEDGELTAYEARGLNLQGTELVVLSACKTGLGQVRNGEGVFGLRRALQEAGAESVLMSLWSVPDEETRSLMTLFYKNWLAGQGKVEALRRAQLELREKIRKKYGMDLPYYWGAFILVGR
jgi:CHAT domain-containing protein/tetratricopeptide (TPR) repeat protein